MKILDEIKKHRTEIQTDSYSMSWGEIVHLYKDKELIIDPEYQRLFRWNLTQQTRFIESILLDIPTPAIFMAQNEDSKHEVIDGLQRISTIIKYFSASIFDDVGEASNKDNTINDIKIPTVLDEGPILPGLKDFTLKTLPESLTISIKRARVNIIFIKKESSKRVRYEVFKRVNTYGTQLEAQEIRNCTARLLGQEFPNALAKLAHDSSVLAAFHFEEERENKRAVEEMVLRLLAFNYSKKPITHDVEKFLDEFMEFASEGKFKLDNEIAERVLKTFRLISEVFPDGKAFKFRNEKKYYGAFSTNVFDAVASGIFSNINKLTDKEKISKRHIELVTSKELKEMTGAGSNTKRKIYGRIELGKKWFAS